MRRKIPMVAATLLTLAAPPGAAGQDDGVYFDDPDSPGGKEYALPLDSGRRAGQGGAADGGPAPRFGAGISPADASSRGSGRGGAEGSAPGGRPRGGGEAVGDAVSKGSFTRGGTEKIASARLAEADGWLSPALQLSALGAGVLLLGGAIGLLVRRNRRFGQD